MHILDARWASQRFSCQKCGGYGHEARDRRFTPRNHHAQRPGLNGAKPSPSVHCAGCAVEIRELPQMKSEKEGNSVIGVKTWRAIGSDEVWSVF